MTPNTNLQEQMPNYRCCLGLSPSATTCAYILHTLNGVGCVASGPMQITTRHLDSSSLEGKRGETNGSVWESIGQPASVTGGLKHGDRGYVLFGAGCLAFGGLGAWGRKKNKMFEKGRGASGKGRAGKGQGQGAEPRFPPSSKSSAFSNYSTRTTTLNKFHSVSLLCSPSFNQSIRGAQPVTESWPSSPRILAASL